MFIPADCWCEILKRILLLFGLYDNRKGEDYKMMDKDDNAMDRDYYMIDKCYNMRIKCQG